jgi:hypothetical protein
MSRSNRKDRARRNARKADRKHKREVKKQKAENARERRSQASWSVSSGPKKMVEYHTLTFSRLQREMFLLYGNDMPAPAIRQHFWRIIPPGSYLANEAQGFLNQYLSRVEAELAEHLATQSIAYWLHIYRRLALGPIGEDKSPGTIANTRAILEAAIQKYGRAELCNKIAPSSFVKLDQVFAGESKGTERYVIKRVLAREPMLVLTDFKVNDLYRFYQLERLAYEIWRTAAMLRITGKGAPIRVIDDFPFVFDERSDELADLVESYDGRDKSPLFGVAGSSTGTVFTNDASDRDGFGFLFTPNVGEAQLWLAEHVLRTQGRNVRMEGAPNYLRLPFNFRKYLEAHRPLEAAFEAKHGVSLEECIVVFASIAYFPEFFAKVGHWTRAWRPEARGYEGAFPMHRYENWITQTVPYLSKVLGCGRKAEAFRVGAVLRWLTWQNERRGDIDLCYPGPHAIFVPVFNPNGDVPEQYFVDYVWLHRRLKDLFYGVAVDNNNFKGHALEQVVQSADMPLPRRQLSAFDGTSKQIDASFSIGSRLFIVECRATSESIGFLKGKPEAIRQRILKVERLLTDVDSKAKWLAAHPEGRNYNIRKFTEIIPIGVTPFIEFIPSLFEWYWLRKGVPRVLTPDELRDEIESSTPSTEYYHGFRVENGALTPPGQ